MPRRDMPCQFESDHAAEGRTAEIEGVVGVNVLRESCGVLGQRLSAMRRRNPVNRPNITDFTLAIE